MSGRPIFGCIEAGGTKFVLGLLTGDGEVLARERIATTTPEETIGAAIAFLRNGRDAYGAPAAIGIASFGPLVLDRADPAYGRVADTPKPGWSGADLVTPFAEAFGCPIALDTDVNGAVLAEGRWGAAAGDAVACYVTIGTGIGGGALVAGRPVHGSRHPEMGHMPVRRHPEDRDFPGICPFHGDCLEGLACGPAIEARWGASLSHLAPGHRAHGIIAHYLAQLVIGQQAILSPSRIVLGGGVMGTPGLLDRIRVEAERLAAGYFGTADYTALIVPPGLGDDAGLQGALALAQEAAREAT